MRRFLIIFLLFSHSLFGQDEEKSIYNQKVDIKGSISFLNFDFNFNDFYWGFSGGIEDIGYQWGARLNFEFRPFYKRVQLPKENGIVRQYQEQKYFLSIDLDKRLGHFNLWNSHMQFYIGSKNGLLWGNYKGTRNDVKSNFVVAPMAGICFNIDDVTFIKIGYLHFNEGVINVPDGKMSIGLTFAI